VCGISLDRVTDELEREGVENFEKSFEDLLEALTRAAREVATSRPR